MHSTIRSRYFGNKAFYRMALMIALPMMIQNGITQFVNLLDNIMVGRVGTLEMGAVGIANQLVFVYNLTIFGAFSGAGIFTAQYYGKGDHAGVQYTVRYKLLIGGLLTLTALLILNLFDTQLISLYLKGDGTEADRLYTLRCAKEYLHVILFTFIPFYFTQVYSSSLKETGKTFVPMIAGVVSVIVNFVFNLLLIFGLLGFPAMGIIGAAVATLLARLVECAIVLVWSHIHSIENRFVLGLYRSFRIPAQLLKTITVKAIPLLMNETLWALGISLLSMCYSMHALEVVSANSMASTISNLFNTAFLAMGQSIGIIVGQLLGAGKAEEAVDTDRKLIIFSLLISLVIGVIMASLSPVIPGVYHATSSVSKLASSFILITALCMPINSLVNAFYFTIRSGGKTFITFLFDCCYVCLIVVPLAYVLTKFTSIGIVPIYFLCCFVDIGKVIIGFILVRSRMWVNNIVGEAA